MKNQALGTDNYIYGLPLQTPPISSLPSIKEENKVLTLFFLPLQLEEVASDEALEDVHIWGLRRLNVEWLAHIVSPLLYTNKATYIKHR